MAAENPFPFIAGSSFHHAARDIGIGTGGLEGLDAYLTSKFVTQMNA